VANAQSRVELIVDAVKALNPLRAVKRSTDKAKEAIDRLKASARKTGQTLEDLGRKGKRGLDKVAKAASRAAGRFGKMGKAAAVAAAAAAGLALVKFSFGAAGELERQTKSLQVLTGSLEKARGIIAELQAFGAVTPFTSQELIETSKRLKAFGFETEQIVDITKRLADVAGATGADLGGIATAFGQIQAKGRLQTEELLQLQERGVGIADELQKMYGMTGEEFSKALQKGQISAKAAEVALIRLTEKGGKYANGAIAQSDTLFGKLSTLQDALQRFGQNIGKVLSPVFKSIITFLTTITNQINNLFRESALATQARKNLRFDTKEGREISRRGGAEARERGVALQAEIERLRKAGFGLDQTVPKMPDTATPELLKGTAGAGKEKEKESPIERQRKQLEKILQTERDRASLASALNDEEQRTFQLNVDLANIKREFPDLSNEELKPLVEATIQTYERIEASEALKKSNKDRADAELKALREQQKEAQRLDQIYGQLGQTIATGVSDMLMAAVDQTKSLAEVASNMLRNLANQLLQVAVNTALFSLFPGSSLFKGLPRFADGGSISSGKPAIVGERGPELFMPGRSGSIVPNNALGGNITVNVDATGTNVQGDAPNANKLGEALGAAVRAELIRQKRPGGLLA